MYWVLPRQTGCAVAGSEGVLSYSFGYSLHQPVDAEVGKTVGVCKEREITINAKFLFLQLNYMLLFIVYYLNKAGTHFHTLNLKLPNVLIDLSQSRLVDNLQRNSCIRIIYWIIELSPINYSLNIKISLILVHNSLFHTQASVAQSVSAFGC